MDIMATKKVVLQLCGLEYEWEGLKKSGDNEWCSGLFCDSISKIELFVDDEELINDEALKHLDRTVMQRTTESCDWKDVVGIRGWYNKACYICEIEVQDTFDPMKLSLNVKECKFVVNNDVLVADEVVLSSIIYDGTVYDFDDIEATGKGSELVWGYDPKEECNDSKDGDIIFVELNDKWGFSNKNGVEIVPPRYDWMGDDFVEDMLVVGIRGKGIGFVNKQGEEIVSPQYEEASDFHKGRSTVCLNGKYGAIDKYGEIVVPLVHDKIGMYTDKIWVAE